MYFLNPSYLIFLKNIAAKIRSFLLKRKLLGIYFLFRRKLSTISFLFRRKVFDFSLNENIISEKYILRILFPDTPPLSKNSDSVSIISESIFLLSDTSPTF